MLSAHTSRYAPVEGLGIEAVSVRATTTVPRIRKAQTRLIDHLQVQFERFVGSNPQLRATLRGLEELGASYHAYGGWVRDHLAQSIHGGDGQAGAKDIDLVVEHLGGDRLGSLIAPPYRMTIFGGYACDGGPWPFDIWALGDTFLIRKFGLPVHLSTLLQVTDFNINAVVFSPATSRRDPALLDGGAMKALRSKVIDFRCEVLPFPLLQAARLLIYGAKLGFDFSDEVAKFIREVVQVPENCWSVEQGILRHAPHYASAALLRLHKLTAAQ